MQYTCQIKAIETERETERSAEAEPKAKRWSSIESISIDFHLDAVCARYTPCVMHGKAYG